VGTTLAAANAAAAALAMRGRCTCKTAAPPRCKGRDQLQHVVQAAVLL
jgi:hypothetical protein